MAIPTPRLRFHRPDTISGVTYKITPPRMEEAVYITINSAEFDDSIRPVEVFVNCKDTKGFQWINVLMRMISAILQHPGPFPEFVISELKDSYDPEGGYYAEKNVWVNSIAGHIGLVIEKHCQVLGLIKKVKS